MKTFAQFLKFVAPMFLVVGVLHLTLGLGADVLLGAKLPPEALADPALDSQNRFYGVAFTLYGVLLWVCASDIPRYATVLKCIFWVFFGAGLARFVSVALHGSPPPLIWALLVGEVLPPPALALWLSKVTTGKNAA